MFMLSYSPMGKFYNNSFIWGGGGVEMSSWLELKQVSFGNLI